MLESLCCDAGDFALPESELVCYFFNPFAAQVMAQVVSNLEKSFTLKPRQVFVIYANPVAGHLFDESSCFVPVRAFGPVRVWKASEFSDKLPRDSGKL